MWPSIWTGGILLQTIIKLAESLGITAIAEGVETEVQREFLAQHGCPIYQGYLFSNPVDLAAFEILIKKPAQENNFL